MNLPHPICLPAVVVRSRSGWSRDALVAEGAHGAKRASKLADRASRQSGFSLLELSIVVGIISVLLAVAVPGAKHLLLQARASALENDLRVFAAAFQTHAIERGDWATGDGAPGSIPPGLGGYLGETNWRRRTPIGGHYAWETNTLQQGSRYRAAIVITADNGDPVTSDRLQLLAIDRKLDDGELSTGNFLLGYRNHPVFVLER